MGLLLLSDLYRIAPSISSQPTDVEVASGGTATFSVSASGGDLRYQWQKNDGTWPGWANISGATSSSYTTPTLSASDDGTCYRCLIYNEVYFVMSSIAATFIGLAATTYYVDATGGNDANAGTSTGAAWQTITKAKSISFAGGDRLLFKRGETFSDTFMVLLSNSTSAGNRLVVGAYGTGAKPIFAMSGKSYGMYASSAAGRAQYIRFSNLDIRTATISCIQVEGRDQISVDCDCSASGNQAWQHTDAASGRNIRCTATTCVDDGISCHDTAGFIDIGGTYYGNAQNINSVSSATMYLYGTRLYGATGADNVDCSGPVRAYGCYITHAAGTNTGFQIASGDIVACIIDGRLLTSATATVIDHTSTTALNVRNNTIIGATGYGRVLSFTGGTITMENNIFDTLATVAAGTGTRTADYNNFNGVTTKSLSTNTNEISGAPAYFSTATNDFMPTGNSVARFAGKVISGIVLDYNGRPFNTTTPSIGAIEART